VFSDSTASDYAGWISLARSSLCAVFTLNTADPDAPAGASLTDQQRPIGFADAHPGARFGAESRAHPCRSRARWAAISDGLVFVAVRLIGATPQG